ncbi:hypothetical protein HDU93_000040 [Gonapodya sp. JEL0774]|nr:hypothetical protein HDU93_000040 [Gonapodya sp. JEL0774]
MSMIDANRTPPGPMTDESHPSWDEADLKQSFSEPADQLRHSLYSLTTQLASTSRDIDALFDAIEDFSGSTSSRISEVSIGTGNRLQYLIEKQKSLQRLWANVIEKTSEEVATMLSEDGRTLASGGTVSSTKYSGTNAVSRLLGPNVEAALGAGSGMATALFLEFTSCYIATCALTFPYGSLIITPLANRVTRIFFSDILPLGMIQSDPSLIPPLPVLLTTYALLAISEIPALSAVAESVFGASYQGILHPAHGHLIGSTIGVWVFVATAYALLAFGGFGRHVLHSLLGPKAQEELDRASKTARESFTEFFGIFITSCALGYYYSTNPDLPVFWKIVLHPLCAYPYGSLLVAPSINRFARIFLPGILPADMIPEADPGFFPHVPFLAVTYLLLAMNEVPTLVAASTTIFGSYRGILLDPGHNFALGYTLGNWVFVWLIQQWMTFETDRVPSQKRSPQPTQTAKGFEREKDSSEMQGPRQRKTRSDDVPLGSPAESAASGQTSGQTGARPPPFSTKSAAKGVPPVGSGRGKKGKKSKD